MRNMEEKKKILTYAGLKALEDELENLKVVKKQENRAICQRMQSTMLLRMNSVISRQESMSWSRF